MFPTIFPGPFAFWVHGIVSNRYFSWPWRHWLLPLAHAILYRTVTRCLGCLLASFFCLSYSLRFMQSGLSVKAIWYVLPWYLNLMISIATESYRSAIRKSIFTMYFNGLSDLTVFFVYSDQFTCHAWGRIRLEWSPHTKYAKSHPTPLRSLCHTRISNFDH